jgi:hypothetical protein
MKEQKFGQSLKISYISVASTIAESRGFVSAVRVSKIIRAVVRESWIMLRWIFPESSVSVVWHNSTSLSILSSHKTITQPLRPLKSNMFVLSNYRSS